MCHLTSFIISFAVGIFLHEISSLGIAVWIDSFSLFAPSSSSHKYIAYIPMLCKPLWRCYTFVCYFGSFLANHNNHFWMKKWLLSIIHPCCHVSRLFWASYQWPMPSVPAIPLSAHWNVIACQQLLNLCTLFPLSPFPCSCSQAPHGYDQGLSQNPLLCYCYCVHAKKKKKNFFFFFF